MADLECRAHIGCPRQKHSGAEEQRYTRASLVLAPTFCCARLPAHQFGLIRGECEHVDVQSVAGRRALRAACHHVRESFEVENDSTDTYQRGSPTLATLLKSVTEKR